MTNPMLGECVIGTYCGKPYAAQADDLILIADEFLHNADPAFVEVAEGFVRISADGPDGPWSLTYRLTSDRDQWGNWYAMKHTESGIDPALLSAVGYTE